MGQVESAFTEKELNDYQELTYFTKKEVLRAHERFASLAPKIVKMDKNANLPFELIMNMPELKVNPFSDRICKVFSSSEDGMTFEDFLDMLSVFSSAAPKSVKTEYAFRIYDFDEDDMLSFEDIREILNRLTGTQQLNEDDIKQIIDNIMEEADLDEDNFLAYAEFEHVIAKSPDFINTFKIRL